MFIDKSGEPRSNKDIVETIQAFKEALVKGKPEPLMVYYTTVIEALTELLERREKGSESSFE